MARTISLTIAQNHGAAHGSTILILIIHNRDMRYYKHAFRYYILTPHNPSCGWRNYDCINGEKEFHVKDQGPVHLYFNCGVYTTAKNISYYKGETSKSVIE